MPCKGTSGDFLLTATTALSIRIGQTCTEEELALLGIYFTVLGDQLTLLSLCKPDQKRGNC